ncbi:6010_t:CDS:2 [Paraglomus brasilianum]|uniref:Pre-mRNA-splicing factor CWC24 n=1 Tax=Paraglomus brasilianum TaxID=144538 RepID=A0A9N8VVS1_9GLOM|nr:6010_t:CDS:2 [Paraglomus brasilianum]
MSSNDTSTIELTDPTDKVPFFKKKSRPNKNIRKRKQTSPEGSSDEAGKSAVVTKERKIDPNSPFVQISRKEKQKEDISVTFSSNQLAAPLTGQDIATRSAEWDTEFDRDAQALLEKKIAAEDAADDDNLYRGQNAYKTYIKKRDTAAGSAASSKIKQVFIPEAGPIRAPTNIRVTSRFDYQPDICKDYKETGYCGYGDSCKFLHDRGDYKTGWQLEREWEEMQGNLRRNQNAFLIESSDEDSEDDLPFACIICRNEFQNPVVTKCGHYFCDKCALDNYRISPKCYACGNPTNGIFNTAKNLLKKLEEKRQRLAEKGELPSEKAV